MHARTTILIAGTKLVKIAKAWPSQITAPDREIVFFRQSFREAIRIYDPKCNEAVLTTVSCEDIAAQFYFRLQFKRIGNLLLSSRDISR